MNGSNDDLRPAFRKIMGKEAHDFQLEVAEHLLNGESVILQAPTGSGKTWTALFPYLYARLSRLAFPRKCLYAVPLRVLATQFKEIAEELVATWTDEEKPKIRLQTGEQQDDPTLEGDLIFTTIDQVLSSALNVPYSLGYRRANMNAGAVVSSFLVCDEVHLFPVDEKTGQGALATLIELLATFGNAIPFLLMTATLSEEMLTLLQKELGAKLVTVSAAELPNIESQQKTRRYHLRNKEPLTARAVLEQHKTRSIVICNQVPRAIHLYDEMCREVDEDPLHKGRTRVQLLHAHFNREHRREKESIIRQQLGKAEDQEEPREESLIIVATQAIEVGLDITCERLHTELAPANAIIQRAGRCARYKGEEGDVFIYDFYQIPDEETKSPHLPYSADLCARTREGLNDPRYNGQVLQFQDEQAIVSAVHNQADKKLLEKIANESFSRWRDMSAAMFLGEKEARPRLIRKVDSRTLLVHPEPSQIDDPYTWHGFSIFEGTLRGWFNKVYQLGLTDWVLCYPVEVPDESQESRKRPTYEWERLYHADQIDVSPLFVIHPDLVAYDREHGFRLLQSVASLPVDIAELGQKPMPQDRRLFEPRYQLESYAEHIGRVIEAYQSGLDEHIDFAGQRLAHHPEYTITAEQLQRAVLLALALHDVGKLQVEWQHWSRAYQAAIGEPVVDQAKMIVHTHRERQHEQAEKAVKLRRPRHAAEGAYASWPIILQALNGDEWLSQAVFTAIARHHAPFVDGVERYTLHPQSQTAIAEALALINIPEQLAALTRMQCKRLPKDGALQDQLIASDDPAQWLIYSLIVRTLRLCDGHAVEWKG